MKQKLFAMIALVAMMFVPQFAWADDVITYHLVTTDEGASAGGTFEKSVDNTTDTSAPKRWGLGSSKYICCKPTAALQAGDKITIIAAPRSGSSAGLKLVSDATGTTEYTTIAGTSGKQNKDLTLSYTIEAENGLIGKTEFYIILADNSRNYWFKRVQVTSASGTAVTFYNIAIDANITNGTVETSATSTIAGAAVKLTATPATGYDFGAWDVKDANNTAVTVTEDKFAMPASNVTVGATFTQAPMYDITIASGIEHGTIAVANSVTQAREGDEIELTITPADGYYLQAMTVMQGETPIYVVNKKFTMPKAAVTISGTFALTSTKGTLKEAFALTTTGDFGTQNTDGTFTKDGIIYEKSGLNNTWDTSTENEAWRMGSTGAYLGCPLPIALRVGDEIIFEGRVSSASTKFYLRTSSNNTTNPVAIITPGSTEAGTFTYTVEAGSALVGAEKFYLMISAASNSYVSSVTINSTASIPRTVTFTDMENGTVQADKATYVEGETVTLTVTPDAGYNLSTISAQQYTTGGSDTPNFAPRRANPVILGDITLTVDPNNSNVYTFTMPDYNVEVSATFVFDESSARYLTVSKEWTVFCSPETFAVPTGLNVYTISAVTQPNGTENGSVTLKSQSIIAEGVPMVIENTAVSTTTKFVITNTTGTIAAADQCAEFKGSATAATPMSSSNINYVLKNGNFVRSTATQAAKYSCFLEIAPAAAAPAPAAKYVISIAGDAGQGTTSINQLGTATIDDGAWYNLNGMRMEKPNQKGVYIHNGKKVVIK